MVNPLSDKNELADKVLRAEPVGVPIQPWTVYRPTAPDYSKNKRLDPQPDRALPSLNQQRGRVNKSYPAGRQVEVIQTVHNPIVYSEVDSGVGQLIKALAGADSQDYSKPLPKKPIQQRNKLR